MPISNSDEGTITEGEFAKVVMLTSGGKAVPTRGLTDDEHRVFDFHLVRDCTDLRNDVRHRASDRIIVPPEGWPSGRWRWS
jgi:hypothetical protein